MKVLIIGGYGVFGSRTARLLARDGHQLWLAGRHPETGQALAEALGAETLSVDIHNAPHALFAVSPDVVIDTAGPFQHYGENPYLVPRLCIDHGCHYLDLSDSSEFTKGIAELNRKAEAEGVFVLSGASSVPGLSSIIVEDLVDGLDGIDLIDIAILPGNRAPRGNSVIKSILSGVGRPSRVFRGNAWQTIPGWTDRKSYKLAPGLKRAGYFVAVPDIHLLPDRIAAKTVMFRAGFELGIMNRSLSALAILRQAWQLELPDGVISALRRASNVLYPFGTDRGGMQVNVTGTKDGQHRSRTWTLIAENGDGPYVPGVVCRAILRENLHIRPGARPCIAELSRHVVINAMSDLSITTERADEDVDRSVPPVFCRKPT